MFSLGANTTSLVAKHLNFYNCKANRFARKFEKVHEVQVLQWYPGVVLTESVLELTTESSTLNILKYKRAED